MMKKTLVEVNYSKLNEDSVIVFQNGKWIAIPKVVFLDGITKKINALDNQTQAETNEIKKDINNIKADIGNIRKQLKSILGEDDNEKDE